MIASLEMVVFSGEVLEMVTLHPLALPRSMISTKVLKMASV